MHGPNFETGGGFTFWRKISSQSTLGANFNLRSVFTTSRRLFFFSFHSMSYKMSLVSRASCSVSCLTSADRRKRGLIWVALA